jgi:modification methylase
MLALNQVYEGDCLHWLPQLDENSVDLAVWSPPYFVGKDYEQNLDYAGWTNLLSQAVAFNARALKAGAFLAINVADILCFPDDSLPRIQAEVAISRRHRHITREAIQALQDERPGISRAELAQLLCCSEQTVDRRLRGNNVRGGKTLVQTRVHLTGALLQTAAQSAGLTLYDRRFWVKDPAWANSQWTTSSYRSVDECEYLYLFWKPGPLYINRARLSDSEWAEWGSRAVWYIPSVRSNKAHASQFPIELPRRLIRLLSEPGQVILDCFAGSGTSLMAAILENRQYLGIEQNGASVYLARTNCQKARLYHQKLYVARGP